MKNDKRKGKRVRALQLHRIKFIIGTQEHTLCNLSQSGLAISLKETSPNKFEDKVLHASIILENQQIDLQIKPIHQTDRFYGFKILNPSDKYSKTFYQLFSKELLAQEMHQIDVKRVKQDPQGLTRWWNGGEDVDFVLVTDPNHQIIRFELVFFGNIIQGGTRMPLTISALKESPDRFKSYSGSQILGPQQKVNSQLIENIISFVHNLADLGPETRDQFVDFLKDKKVAA